MDKAVFIWLTLVNLFKKNKKFHVSFSIKRCFHMVSINNFSALAQSIPGAIEFPHFELTSFKINKRILATLEIEKNRVCLMHSPNDQSVFIAFDSSIIYPLPNKWGKNGAT